MHLHSEQDLGQMSKQAFGGRRVVMLFDCIWLKKERLWVHNPVHLYIFEVSIFLGTDVGNNAPTDKTAENRRSLKIQMFTARHQI